MSIVFELNAAVVQRNYCILGRYLLGSIPSTFFVGKPQLRMFRLKVVRVELPWEVCPENKMKAPSSEEKFVLISEC